MRVNSERIRFEIQRVRRVVILRARSESGELCLLSTVVVVENGEEASERTSFGRAPSTLR